MSPSQPYRKPNTRLGGFEVRICGHIIQKEGSIVCTLPPGGHGSHAAVVIGGHREIYAFLETFDGDVQVWQLVGPQE